MIRPLVRLEPVLWQRGEQLHARPPQVFREVVWFVVVVLWLGFVFWQTEIVVSIPAWSKLSYLRMFMVQPRMSISMVECVGRIPSSRIPRYTSKAEIKSLYKKKKEK